MPYANNKGADQPAHPHSLISVFVVRCLNSVIHILAKSKISTNHFFSNQLTASCYKVVEFDLQPSARAGKRSDSTSRLGYTRVCMCTGL